MPMQLSIVRSTRRAAALTPIAALALLAGCQADYAVDLTNKTPQPIFASVIAKGTTNPGQSARKRLGPGDRASIGPIRNDNKKGAMLSVDSLPNPNRPIVVDLPPGESYFTLIQDGDQTNSPVRLVEKP